MQKLPIGVQDFTTLRTENFIYVDKTRYLYDLVTNGRVYFLSRPRRFGKSLLISTLEAILKGKKNLFNGLWIEQSDYDWTEYPVLRIDMSQVTRTSPELFEQTMKGLLLDKAKEYSVWISREDEPVSGILNQLIDALSRIDKVVVLIDEYDKPILDNLDNNDLAVNMRNKLRDFYTILKAQDGNIKFILLTGVTKFSKVSVFSGLNNLTDLTLDNGYASILGYTQSELETVFRSWIDKLAKKNKHTVLEELSKIKLWYNGYQFSSEGEPVYNPFSTLLLFQQQEYRAHWFATGTPTFLLKLIEKENFDITKIEEIRVRESAFATADVNNLDVFSLLYQTGYLTIKNFYSDRQSYQLNYPNREVELGFTESLLEYTTKISRAQQDTTMLQLVDWLVAKDYQAFFDELKRFFSTIPYYLHIKSEKYYQGVLYFIFRLMGIEIDVEVHTSLGSIDAVITLKDCVLIFEFKLDQSVDIALAQIHDKKYAEPYKNLGKEIQLFGVEFSTKEHNIFDWKNVYY